MIKKAFVILLILHLLQLAQSCCVYHYNYKWTGFEIGLLDNSGWLPVPAQSRNLSRKGLGFRIFFSDTTMTAYRKISSDNACYATSCGSSYQRLHSLNGIIIRTLNDYSPAFTAGKDITWLFAGRMPNQSNKEYETIPGTVYRINTFSRQDNYPTHDISVHFDLYLLDSTCTPGPHIFEIDLVLNDGTTLTNHTDTLNLQ